MKTAKKTVIGIAGGLVLAAAFVLAQDAPRRPRMPPGGMEHGGRCGERLVRSLDLTAEQQASLDALRNDTAAAVRPLVQQMRALHGQIETAADETSPDACALGGLVLQGKSIRSQIEDVRKAAEAKFVADLSDAQKATYTNFVSINPGCMAVGAGFPPPPPRD